MNRCRHTDAILDATFAGAGLTRDQASHATTCAECAGALSDAQRFNSELDRIGLELAPEPIPSPADMARVSIPHAKGGTWMSTRRAIIGAAVVAVIIGIGIVVSRQGMDGFGIGLGGAPAATLSGEQDGWLRDAEQASSLFSAHEPQVVRFEQCGDQFSAVLTDSDAREFYWVFGPSEDAAEAMVGVSTTPYVVNVAREKAVAGAICERIIETTISRADAGAAVERMGGLPGGAEVRAAGLLEPETAVVVMEGSFNPWDEEQWWVGLLHRSEEGWSGDPQQWIGTNLPPTDGLKVVNARTLDQALPRTDLLLAVMPPGAAALEIDIKGIPHRFDADPGAATMIVALPSPREDVTTVRYLDADSQVIGEHTLDP